jgi:lipopolysaccharide/colanic/teichoic acid biosynthesis glycosyltransferase
MTLDRAPSPPVRSDPAKRTFDLLASGSLLILFSPLLLVAGAAVAATSTGGPFFLPNAAPSNPARRHA